MSTNLRLCTFNVENLFRRFDFSGFSDDRSRRYLPPAVQFLADFDGDLTEFEAFKALLQSATIAQLDDHRQHTALALTAAQAHLYCLQEVDDLDALIRFWDAYVKKIGALKDFPNAVLIEGNDPRGIDVAAMSRDIVPVYARSHAALTRGDLTGSDSDFPGARDLVARFQPAQEKADNLSGRIFRRDCLELEVEKKGWDGRITVMNCHFKSMGGRSPNKIGMRQLEAAAVRAILERKFDDPADALWVVCGDLNSYKGSVVDKADGSEDIRPDTADGDEELSADGVSGLDPLLENGFGIDLLADMPPEARWTHYYPGKRHKTQLDHVIASPAMARRMVGQPQIVRDGMPFRVPATDNIDRYPRIGWDRPKASDHCPVVVEFRASDPGGPA
ncbi:MAG: endonuclease/exonuclease/phosphatase family protein [Pseudomonadota bacterium]